MATGNSVAPVIIKRKKVVGGGGHHGGAWKVAYADFVTAMMAFFMLMWLLNATTEKQRTGIADYFNPSVPINRISGGGNGAFGGDSIFSENSLVRSGTGASGNKPPWADDQASSDGAGKDSPEAQAMLEELNATLIGHGGESDLIDNALKHVVTKISDEGVVIEIFDLPNSPLFNAANQSNPVLVVLLARIAGIASNSENNIAISTHSRTIPVVKKNGDLWKRTSEQSLEVSRVLRFSGVPEHRLDRIVGKSNTEPFDSDELSVRNNRVEITFLIESFVN